MPMSVTAPRRGYMIDALTVLVGAVRKGAQGRPAETRTGAARLLTTRLEANGNINLVAYGPSNAAGGYIIEVSHVAQGGALPASNASSWVQVAVVTCRPGIQEIPLSGVDLREKARIAGSVTGEVRVAAIRATAGTKAGQSEGNGVLVPVGANTISLQPAPSA
jgi:hypothetical protein